MKVDLSNNPEMLGLFGLTWKERIASFMGKQLKGTKLKKLTKSFWGAGGMNMKMISNLHNEYMAFMAQGKAPSSFTLKPDSTGAGGTFSPSTIKLAELINDKTNTNSTVILEFLRALYVLSKNGRIPFNKWNPKGYVQSTKLRKTFKSEQNVIDAVKSGTNYAKILLAVAAVGAGAYLLKQAKGFKV